mgnify:CR=1 FL=1
MSTALAKSTDFFSTADSARSEIRSLWSKILSCACVTLALLTLIPLFSIVLLVLKNGLPLLTWRVFTELRRRRAWLAAASEMRWSERC